MEQAADHATRADLKARAREADEAYIARAHELQGSFKPPVAWWDALRFGRLAKSLGRARDMSSLITRYEQLDVEMEQVERATSAVTSVWDALCEQAFEASVRTESKCSAACVIVLELRGCGADLDRSSSQASRRHRAQTWVDRREALLGAQALRVRACVSCPDGAPDPSSALR